MNKYFIGILYLVFSLSKGMAQDCFEADTHIWKNTWDSCTKSNNPNSDHGETHWILYDFSEIRNMSKSWIWNCNDPDELDKGFSLINIDYSLDGSNWTNWGEFNCPKANGDAIYSGFPGPDLQGVKCQFILLTVISNHGDSNCAGIAEIKFNLFPGYEESIISTTEDLDMSNDQYIVQPNPTDGLMYISGKLKENMNYHMLDSYGRIHKSGFIGSSKNSINISDLPSGMYYLKLEDSVSKVIKIN